MNTFIYVGPSIPLPEHDTLPNPGLYVLCLSQMKDDERMLYVFVRFVFYLKI